MKDLDETVSALGRVATDAGPSKAYVVVVRGSNAGEIFPVKGPFMVIGRGAGADLRVNDEGVSRFHAKLIEQPLGFVVEDLGSRNGTYCNGDRVAPGMRPLKEGDRLQIGTTFVLRFTFLEGDSLQTSTPSMNQSNDPVTGSYSRRYFMEQLEKDVGAETKIRLSLVLLHIDRFEDLATAHGQAFADQLAIAVANHIRANLRNDDILSRLDGGDFALLSRGASSGDTFMLAERIRTSAPSVSIQGGDERHQITLSIGIASVTELPIDTAHEVMVAGGSALHRARSAGGNCVVLCTPELLGEPKNRAKV